MQLRYLIYVLIALSAFGAGYFRNANGELIMSDTSHLIVVALALVFLVLLEFSYRQAIQEIARQVVKLQARNG